MSVYIIRVSDIIYIIVARWENLPKSLYILISKQFLEILGVIQEF